MKNINKIIESDFEISDKCSWWYDTQKNIVKRYTTGMWVPISGSYKKGYLSGGEGIDVKTDEELINIKYNEKQLTVNNKNQLELNGYTPLAKKVRWCRRGKIDLDRNEVYVVPPRARCNFIRFSSRKLRELFSKSVKCRLNSEDYDKTINVFYKVTLIDNKESNEIKSNIKFQLTLDNYLDKYGEYRISWKAKNPFITGYNSKITAIFNRYGTTIDSPDETQTLAVTILGNNSLIGKEFNATADPYVVIVNPFIQYGGYVIVNGYYIDSEGYIVIDVELKNIEPNTYLYDICNKNYLHFNQYGVCDKGSFTSCRRFFMISIYYKQFRHINVYSVSHVDVLNNVLNPNKHNDLISHNRRIRAIYGEFFKIISLDNWKIGKGSPSASYISTGMGRNSQNVNIYIGRRDLLYPKQWSGFEEKERVSVKTYRHDMLGIPIMKQYVNSFVI